jgi:phage shock protein C
MEPTTDTVGPSLDKQFPEPQPIPEPASQTVAPSAAPSAAQPAMPSAPKPASAVAAEALDPPAPVASAGRGFRLHRSRTDRMLGGVCGGLAESLGVDAALLRVGLIALTLLGAGIGVVLYLAAWILAPEADA